MNLESRLNVCEPRDSAEDHKRHKLGTEHHLWCINYRGTGTQWPLFYKSILKESTFLFLGDSGLKSKEYELKARHSTKAGFPFSFPHHPALGFAFWPKSACPSPSRIWEACRPCSFHFAALTRGICTFSNNRCPGNRSVLHPDMSSLLGWLFPPERGVIQESEWLVVVTTREPSMACTYKCHGLNFVTGYRWFAM